MNEEMIEISMSIILHAGNARVELTTCMQELSEFKLDEAKAHLVKAKAEVLEAHKIHTKIMQEETSGKKVETGILFSHAQDTLMTINSEVRLSEQLLALSESIDQRFKKLEA